MAIYNGTAGNDAYLGTSGDDTFYGLAGNDSLNGAGGNDLILGDAGNDSLFGGGGNDILNGGAGVDYMRGGGGNDRYFIFSEGENVREEVDAGIDNVLTGISYTLEENFENLTLLTSSAAGANNDINGTGNAVGNTLTGNAGSNVLDGKAGNDVLNGLEGNDVLIGGTGNDRYIINSAGDVAFEASGAPAGGIDAVLSTVSYTAAFGIENVTLQGTAALNATGNTLNNGLTGNAGANVLSGGAGNDLLNGGGGIDRLTGGAGSDTFQFGSPAAGGDTITDFRNATGNDDRFTFVAAQFGGLLKGQLAEERFVRGAAAQEADDRFIWNDDDNTLSFDANGNAAGGVTLLATLDDGATVTAADIFII